MQFWCKDLFHLSGGLQHQRAVIHHPRRMDHGPHRAKAFHPLRHGIAHVFHVTHIRRCHKHLPAQCLKPLQRQYPPRNRIAWVMRRQKGGPRLPIRQSPPRDQGYLRTKAPDDIFGNGQPDAAKSARDQHMRALWQRKLILRQGNRFKPLRIASRAPQRRNCAGRRGQNFLKNLIGQCA